MPDAPPKPAPHGGESVAAPPARRDDVDIPSLRDDGVPSERPKTTVPQRPQRAVPPIGRQPAKTPSRPDPEAPLLPSRSGPMLRRMIQQSGLRDLFEIRLIEGLVRRGFLAPGRIGEFVQEARRHHLPLYDHTLASRVAPDEVLLEVVASARNMESVILGEVELEEDLAQLIRPDQARDWKAMPYSRSEEGELLVACADPGSVKLLEEMPRALPGERIVFKLALPNELAAAVDTLYGPQELLDELRSGDEPEEEDFTAELSIDAPVVRMLNQLLRQAMNEQASDIHIEPGERQTTIRIRVDGLLNEVMTLDRRSTQQMVALIKTWAKMRTDERRRPQDGHFTRDVDGNRADVRIVTVPSINGETATMRVFDQRRAFFSLEDLGFSDTNMRFYRESISQPYGLALITGPTGSGKTSTLYASLQTINSPDRKIYSVEDPVEIRMRNVVQVQVSRSSGIEGWDFKEALRSLVRADPDVIMVGEIRDSETAKLAIDAAQTGHFVFSTLHTNDAISAVTRLGEFNIERYLMSQTIEVVVAQRLVRRLCQECREPLETSAEELRVWRVPEETIRAWESEELILYQPRPGGCMRCSQKGFRGRIGVHEVLRLDRDIKDAIEAGKELALVREMARERGMISLREDGMMKAVQGVTSLEEIARWIQ